MADYLEIARRALEGMAARPEADTRRSDEPLRNKGCGDVPNQAGDLPLRPHEVAEPEAVQVVQQKSSDTRDPYCSCESSANWRWNGWIWFCPRCVQPAKGQPAKVSTTDPTTCCLGCGQACYWRSEKGWQCSFCFPPTADSKICEKLGLECTPLDLGPAFTCTGCGRTAFWIDRATGRRKCIECDGLAPLA